MAEAIGKPNTAPIADPPAKRRLSPMTRRKWANFKANRRGFWGLWIIGILVLVTLFSEFLANPKPLLLTYRGDVYFPVLFTYPETLFDGVFETEADYTSPTVLDLIRQGDGVIVWAPIRFAYDTIDFYTADAVPEAPSERHWLGTDDVGRDVMARIIYGFRLSVWFGLALTFMSAAIGVTVGATQGYFGGILDLAGQRVVEIWGGLPMLFIIMILTSLIEPSAWALLLLLLLFNWIVLVPVVRAEFLRTRNFDYVNAAKALGQKDSIIIVRYVLPNAMVATLTYLPFLLSGSIVTLTSLDFLGFGLPAGYPSLGELLAQGKANIQAPWLGLSAFFTMVLMLTLLVFIGEAVRDAFDPRRSG